MMLRAIRLVVAREGGGNGEREQAAGAIGDEVPLRANASCKRTKKKRKQELTAI